MNLALDELICRVLRDPDLLDDAKQAPHETADRAGVALADLAAVLDGDLLALHGRGAHPLLLMQLAAALSIDPMLQMGDAPVQNDRWIHSEDTFDQIPTTSPLAEDRASKFTQSGSAGPTATRRNRARP